MTGFISVGDYVTDCCGFSFFKKDFLMDRIYCGECKRRCELIMGEPRRDFNSKILVKS